ncbi:O-antigen ligase family protein [Candidatus Thioglobus sp.]|nr:O-antigen ligase family protein [Candidatus Thioglobus sp.]
MIEQSLGKNYSRFVNVLIFIFPIVINSLQVAGDIVLFVLAMMGVFIAISQRLSPFIIKEIKVFSYLTIGYFTAVCLSVLFSGQMAELAHYIPRDFYFLFAPFIALALYKAEINRNYLIVGAKISLLVVGGIIIYFGGGRNTGVMNAGVFGNLSVMLFFIVLTFSFSQHEALKHKVFSFIALLSGIVAIVGSGTRGAWLSFFLLLGVYLYFVFKQQNKLFMRSKIIIVLIILSIVTLTSFNQSIKYRSQSAYTQIDNWLSGDINPSSVGLRLNMYKKAINNIEDVPFSGYGLRTSNINLFQNDSSSMGVISVRFNHLHNAFLTNYYNGGIFLLGALLFILFVPMIIFLNANSQNRENPVFIAGVLLTVGYASIGMVNILLGDTYMNGFYTFFLAIFMVLYAQSIKISST